MFYIILILQFYMIIFLIFTLLISVSIHSIFTIRFVLFLLRKIIFSRLLFGLILLILLLLLVLRS